MNYRFFQKLLALATSGVLLSCATTSYAWGERGHNLISRVAARLVAERTDDKAMPAVFLKRELTLGHLANVPDIVWRASPDAKVVAANFPTHFIDADLLMEKPALKGFPFLIPDAKAAATKFNKNLFTEVGTAPWRVQQLFNAMQAAFAEIKPDPATKQAAPRDQVNPLTDKALLNGGIMSHFIADMSQPLHNGKDYDGWAVGQGGIHSYFEEGVLSALDLRFDYEVYSYASINKPFRTELGRFFPAETRAQNLKDPLTIAVGLSLLNFSYIPELQKLDKAYAVTAPSYEKDLKVAAKRRPPAQTARHFRQFAMKRVALAADTLANLWVLAWENAGKPDLSNYASYYYPVVPDFIVPDYVEQ